MAKKTRTGVYKAKEGFATSHNGQMLMVGAGALVPSELPYDVMDGREHLFIDIATVRSVEQATAAPVEKQDAKVLDEPVDEEAELAALRKAAKDAGVKVDNRWGPDRLREEIAKAG